jgi:hypothetical protein
VILFISIALLVAALAWLAMPQWRRYRRARLRRAPLPARFEPILECNVPLCSRLPEPLRAELRGHINVFLDEKKFIGCNGMQIDDEVRVTVAAHACMLLLNRPARYFPGFSSILVYPDTYVVRETTYEDLVEMEEEETRHGESWHRGPVVLSWEEVLRGAAGVNDGNNVVLHEFAHKLDEENDVADGLPILQDEGQYAAWAHAFMKEYRALEGRAVHGMHAVLDDYALTSPAEFFAVATESFFEKPKQMKEVLPELYEQLKRYYALDPAHW